jgi:hypothetical protein
MERTRLLRTPGWQLPWLRVGLILRALAREAVGGTVARDVADEREALLRVQRKLTRAGWFN